MKRLLVIGFFFEIGFVLIVVPWSAFWDRNYFALLLPQLETLITNNVFRGAISGLGLVNVLAGLADLVSLLAARPSDRHASINPSPLTED